MAPKLYMSYISPGVRAVLLTAEALNLKFEHIFIDVTTEEYLKNETFLSYNPQHTIPTLVEEDGTVVCDSHAIIVYLVEKYDENNSLYPKDVRIRASINQRLHFDTEYGFSSVKAICKPILREQQRYISKDVINRILEAYSYLEKFLQSRDWLVGSSVTLADLSLISSFSQLNVAVPIDESFPNILKWIALCETLPYYDQNLIGLREFNELLSKHLE